MAQISHTVEKASDNATFYEFVRPSFIVYMAWWIPYSIWLLSCGLKLEAQGYEIGFTYFATFGVGKVAHYLTCKKVAADSKVGSAISFLFVHMICIYIPSICLCYVFFINYWANFVLVFVSLALSTWRGANYYEYLMVGAFEKILKECEDAERKKHDDLNEKAEEEAPESACDPIIKEAPKENQVAAINEPQQRKSSPSENKDEAV